MNFSQVKSVTIPEGEVKKIEVGGVTVWEKRIPVTGIEIISRSPVPVTKSTSKVFFNILPSDATDKGVSFTIVGQGYTVVNSVSLTRSNDADVSATLYITTNDGGFEDTIELYKN